MNHVIRQGISYEGRVQSSQVEESRVQESPRRKRARQCRENGDQPASGVQRKQGQESRMVESPNPSSGKNTPRVQRMKEMQSARKALRDWISRKDTQRNGP